MKMKIICIQIKKFESELNTFSKSSQKKLKDFLKTLFHLSLLSEILLTMPNRKQGVCKTRNARLKLKTSRLVSSLPIIYQLPF